MDDHEEMVTGEVISTTILNVGHVLIYSLGIHLKEMTEGDRSHPLFFFFFFFAQIGFEEKESFCFVFCIIWR